MGNTVLLRPWLLDGASVGTVGSEAGGLIAENLLDPGPRLVWRASDLGNAYAEFDLGKRARWRYVCPVGGLVTASPNLLQNSDDFDGTGWSLTGVTLSDDTGQVDPFGDIPSQKLTEDGANSRHNIEHTRTVAFNAGGGFQVFSAYCNSEGERERVVLSITYTGGGGGVAHVVFDVSAGASDGDVHAVIDTGTVTVESYGSEKLANGWWRVWTVSSESASIGNMTIEVGSADSSNSTIYTGDSASVLYLSSIQLETTNSTTQPTDPHDYVNNGDAEGALWRWRGSTAIATLTSSPGYDSGEIPFALNGRDYRGHPNADSFLDCGAVQTYRYGRIDIIDANNADGQIDLNRLFVDEGINLGPSSPFGSQLPGYQESTIERYRTQSDRLVTRQHVSKKTNSYSLNIQSRETVRLLQEVSRRQGSSRDVVLVHDPSGTHTQEGLVHGVLGNMSPPVLTKTGLYKMNISIEEL